MAKKIIEMHIIQADKYLFLPFISQHLFLPNNSGRLQPNYLINYNNIYIKCYLGLFDNQLLIF